MLFSSNRRIQGVSPSPPGWVEIGQKGQALPSRQAQWGEDEAGQRTRTKAEPTGYDEGEIEGEVTCV